MAIALALLGTCTYIGCSSAPPAFEATSEPHDAPPLRLDASEGDTLLVMQAPTPGWQITLEGVREALGRQDVFVTIRRPSPLFMYPQMVVDQRLGTSVPPGKKLAAFVRVLPFDAKANDETPFRVGPAGSVEPIKRPERGKK